MLDIVLRPPIYEKLLIVRSACVVSRIFVLSRGVSSLFSISVADRNLIALVPEYCKSDLKIWAAWKLVLNMSVQHPYVRCINALLYHIRNNSTNIRLLKCWIWSEQRCSHTPWYSYSCSGTEPIRCLSYIYWIRSCFFFIFLIDWWIRPTLYIGWVHLSIQGCLV